MYALIKNLALAVTGSVLAVACLPGEPVPGTGEACGGIAGKACEEPDTFCNFPTSTQCGSGDQQGECTAIPEVCDKLYQPVCGCDGKTYGNACEARSASVSVKAKGECAGSAPGALCGGLQGKGCGAGEYCSFPADAQCGAADQTGVCAKKPQACTLQYDPVCGCDDKPYGNACAAASAGVSVAYKGECK
ncbi:MAG: Kazal-type serine protease inhibitor family protein [Myxococcales bacterium]